MLGVTAIGCRDNNGALAAATPYIDHRIKPWTQSIYLFAKSSADGYMPTV